MVASRAIVRIEAIRQVLGQRIEISASLGVCYWSPNTVQEMFQPSELIRNADEAMYVAKRAGKGRFKSMSYQKKLAKVS